MHREGRPGDGREALTTFLEDPPAVVREVEPLRAPLLVVPLTLDLAGLLELLA